MPEANVLYAVTAVVVAGLVAWVAFVLKTAKEPWARPVSVSSSERVSRPDVPIEKEPIRDDEEEPAADAPQSSKEKAAASSRVEAEASAAEDAADETKPDEKKEDAKA